MVYGTSFVSPLVEAFGKVIDRRGELRRREHHPQGRGGTDGGDRQRDQRSDNVTFDALEKRTAISNETSLAHHATIEDSQIGNFAFLGFNAEVLNSTLEDGAFVLHGARVENVTIPENGFVKAGQVVDEQSEADALPQAEEASGEFRREVLDVNKEFAEGYIDLAGDEGNRALQGVGPNPETSFNDQDEPDVPDSVTLDEFVRIVGAWTSARTPT